MARRFISIVMLLLAAAVLADSVSPKVAPPDAEAQKAALGLVDEAYKDDLAKAVTPQQRADLAKKMLADGIATNEAAGRFVLLNKARDMAAQAGGVEAALAAVDEMDKGYQIDALRMKADVLALAVKALRPVDGLAGVVEKCNPVIDAAVGADRYELAERVADVALATARRGADPALTKQAATHVSMVQACAAAFVKLRVPLATLANNPTDPDANLAVGRFRCFFKSDWDGGLPMLALGSDPTLKALAAKDIAGADDAAAQVALGDGWWAVAENESAAAKNQILKRAGKWYGGAIDKLAGLEKAKVAARLKILADLENRNVGPAVGPRTFQNSIGMKFVEIKSGTFTMGTPPGEVGRSGNETQHEVTLSKGFYMAITPVTQTQWIAVMRNNPSQFKGDTLPVEQVNWDDAVAFCATLSKKENKHYRLPTEAQWEYTCRAGTRTAYNTGNDEVALDKAGWYKNNSADKTHPVAQRQPNAWGLYDMHGNVLQWCSDWAGDYPVHDQRDPIGPAEGKKRIVRGGSWYFGPQNCRSGCHWGVTPDLRHGDFGFRVVLDLN